MLILQANPFVIPYQHTISTIISHSKDSGVSSKHLKLWAKIFNLQNLMKICIPILGDTFFSYFKLYGRPRLLPSPLDSRL